MKRRGVTFTREVNLRDRTFVAFFSFLAILIGHTAAPVFGEAVLVPAMECNFWTRSYNRRDLSRDDPLVKACTAMAKASELLGSGLANTFEQSLPRKGDRRPDAIKIAGGLTSPDGLAIHPVSGDIYVSEEDASRVSVLRNGEAVRVLDRSTPVYDPPRTPTHIPANCPKFLAEVLKYGGADFSDGAAVGEVSFSEFADRVAMVSLDAFAVPVVEGSDMEDPITSLQFVVFNPNTIVMTENGIDLPLGIFILRRASGEVLTTKCNGVSAVHMDFLNGQSSELAHGQVPVPYPGAVNVSADGIANVHFLGMQQVPDFHIVLNPGSPEDSYVVVDRHDSKPTEYRLRARRDGELREKMVISYSKHLHKEWLWLGYDSGVEFALSRSMSAGLSGR